MGLKQKKVKLRTYFIQYLLVLFLCFVLAVFVCIGLLFIAMNTGFVCSVSEVEVQIRNQEPVISSAKTLDPSMIPQTCKYAVVSPEGVFLSGTMGKAEADMAWETIQSGSRISGITLGTGLNARCYFPIERQNEVCIVEYSALSQYSSGFLREHLPPPEIVLLCAILAAFLIEIILLSKIYGRKISRKLLPLQRATEKIQNKDLEFAIQYSGIQEIDAALRSLDSMKTELKQSLEKQWKSEQTRKEQISALAHDIKTPLTVIRGNAEMLNDTDQTEDQKDFTRYILKNADQMEQYVQMLIDLSKAEAGYPLRPEQANMRTFLDDLYSKINAIASVKQLKTEFDEQNLPDTIQLDLSLIQRAILNVV